MWYDRPMIKRTTSDRAIQILLEGGVGVLPTDTVYGLVARAADPGAVAKLYELKHREHKPGTVIAASVEQLVELGVPDGHLRRVAHLWPASLSVETPLGENLSYLHQETGRQAFRVVADVAVRALLEQTGPLVTSSANQPGRPGSVTIAEAEMYFEDEVDFYLDGGDLSGRAPSTIIRVLDDGLEIIREGAVKIDQPVAECPFCLSNGRLKGEILAQSDGGFMIAAASSDGNYLIVPKVHVEDPAKLPVNWWHEMRELLPQVPDLGEHYNLSLNVGKLAGQSVKHLHFWVVKRESGRGSSGKGLARLIGDADSL